MTPFELAIAEYIIDSWEDEEKPSITDCQDFMSVRLSELESLPAFLSSMPFDPCNGSLLRAAISQAISSIDWDDVCDTVDRGLNE